MNDPIPSVDSLSEDEDGGTVDDSLPHGLDYLQEIDDILFDLPEKNLDERFAEYLVRLQLRHKLSNAAVGSIITMVNRLFGGTGIRSVHLRDKVAGKARIGRDFDVKRQCHRCGGMLSEAKFCPNDGCPFYVKPSKCGNYGYLKLNMWFQLQSVVKGIFSYFWFN